MDAHEHETEVALLRRYLVTLLGSAALALLALCLLPYPEYLRYFEVIDDGRPKPPWIYHRIHHGEDPIDIAFFGTSRTDGAVDSSVVEATIERETGVRLQVVNFALFRTGRNMHWLLAKELLENRKAKMVLFEMGPLEDRLGHPQFINLADPWEVVLAPFAFNLRYFGDLIRLPGREAYLFLRRLQIAAGLRSSPFGPDAAYGSNFDRVDAVPGLTEAETQSRDVTHSLAHLEAERQAWLAGVTPPVLPARFQEWEWRMDRLHVEKTRQLAADRGAVFAIHYLPFYGSYQLPDHLVGKYQGEVPIFEAPDFVDDPTCWFDFDHLNARCGRRYSEYLGRRISEYLLAEPGTLREDARFPSP